uniref:F-box domain-containing protein n=1 Tax=Phaeocystis antarctica TaxID=33657 RepID=A0A7S0E4N5_9EUKA|mmetsp:Transcript_16098/g.38220  ORF Transcript_16098/g.38220 Transcript_16098/m.38220 type:complete len:205 (+) Transcript_16098:157-771(+)
MSRACKRPASSAGSSRELRHRRNTDAFPISDLPLELADRIFATLGLLDLSRIVAVSRFCHDRLPTAITACSLRLKLGGYANAVGLRSTNTLLAHLDAALPRLPRAIVVTWLADFDWRVRLAGLRALSLRGGGDSEGDSAGVSEQHGAAIAALQADPDPAVSALARSLLSRIDPNRLTSPVRPEAGDQEAGGSESEDVEANVPPT